MHTRGCGEDIHETQRPGPATCYSPDLFWMQTDWAARQIRNADQLALSGYEILRCGTESGRVPKKTAFSYAVKMYF